MNARGATPIPVPNPIAIVHTKSGNVERTVAVPLGGVAVPIDVDNGQLLGLLSPDVDVSVGLIAAEELPGRPIVPTVRIARNQLAVTRSAPAPPLKIDVTVEILDAAKLNEKLATVTYGYETPPGGRIPPLVKMKLLGPITSGFIDPLEAVIDAPGYEAPLTFNAKAITRGLDAVFKLTFDPLPNRIHFVEDPRDDGLDFRYDHQGPNPDVNLTGRAELTDKQNGDKRTIDAAVDRLPPQIGLSYTGDEDGLSVDYTQALATSKPDVEANYRETKGDGTVATDANIKVAGLPTHLAGTLRSSENAEGNSSLSFADFRVLDGGQIDAIDFLARNWVGDPAGMPEVDRRPDQYVDVVSRDARFRAAGHVERIRAVRFERAGEGFDVTTDIGDGVKPLRASLDTDSRGPGASADAKRIALDTTITPLPRQIHATFRPATETEPTRIHYESPVKVDVDAAAEIDAGAATGCGEREVTCATARIEQLPPSLDLALPGEGQTDYTLDHTGTEDPDVRATVDSVNAENSRTWADVRLDDVPRHVLGRVARQPDSIMTAAEFHAEPDSLGSVRFTIRGRPDRQGLPPRPDATSQHVTLLSRDGAFEVEGRVDDIRHVAVHQRPSRTDPLVAANLGYLVDTGSGAPFDVKVDSDTADEDVPGHRSRTYVDAHVDNLPTTFSGCLRSADPDNAPQDEPDDDLLQACDRTTVPGFGALDSTPLSLSYDAEQNTKATVKFSTTGAVETETGSGAYTDRTTAIDTTINAIPKGIDVDVVAPDEEHPERQLRVRYQAENDAVIPRVDVGFQSRGASDVCGDPRPGRATLCLDATLRNVPGRLALRQNPDPAQGDIDVQTPVPKTGTVDIDPLHLQTTSETGASPLDVSGSIVGLTPHMTARLRSIDPDGEGEAQPRLAEVSFDACPGGRDEDCDGIDEIDVDAHNGFFADALPEPPDESTTHKLSFVGRGDDYRARVNVKRFKSIGYSAVGADGNLSKTTTINAGLGSQPDESLHAYVDIDDGARSMRLDGRIDDMPRDIELCLRPALTGQDPPAPEDGSWCEKAPRDKTAIRADIAAPGDERTDIDIDELRMHTYAGNRLLRGSVKATDLPPRLQLLTGSGARPDVDARALKAGDDDEDLDQIGRLRFSLRNFEGGLGGDLKFPFRSIDGTLDPIFDTRNADTSATYPGDNYVSAHIEPTHMSILGDVPLVRHVSLTPDRCKRADGEYDDERFPPAADFESSRAPSYTCVMAKVAARRPLGLSLRTLDNALSALSVDGVNIDDMPAGGLAATLASTPDKVAKQPVCGSSPDAQPAGDGCRPPLFSLESPRASGQDAPTFAGRMSFGPLDLLAETRESRPLDEDSRLLDYEELPQEYDADGARVHIGGRAGQTALRAGMRVKLAKFIDLDPPTTFGCLRETNSQHFPIGDCLEPSPDIGPDANNGAESTELAFKLSAAEDEPGGSASFGLGRVALLKDDLDTGSQLVLTGVPPADGPDGLSTHGPENPVSPPGPERLGALLPSHLGISVRQRNLYDANKKREENSSRYMQIDATSDKKLNLGLRLNDAGAMGSTRNGTRKVSGMALALRNAPATADLSRPGFRARVQMSSPEVDPPPEDNHGCEGEGFNDGYTKDHGAGLAFCVITPNPELMWLDAGLNAQPDASNPPARTIDALVVRGGPERLDGQPDQTADGATIADAELRGFENVLDGTSGEDRTPAKFTAQVGARLRPFNLGLEHGIGVGLIGHYSRYRVNGDLIVGLDGTNVTRMRPNVDAGPARLQSQGGPLSLHADLRATAETYDLITVLFGAIQIPISSHTNGSYHHPIGLQECRDASDGGGLGTSHTVDDYTMDGPGNVPLAIGQQGDGFFAPPPDFWYGNHSFGLFSLAAQWYQVAGCSGHMQTPSGYQPDFLPAPAYPEPLRPATGLPPSTTLQSSAIEPAAPAAETADLTIDEGDTLFVCKPLTVETLRVNGTLQVGAQGTTATSTVADKDGNLTQVQDRCTGDLTITANRVFVGTNGRILANGTRTEPNSGTPTSGQGGGGGHDTDGGAAGDDAGPGGPSTWESGDDVNGGSPGRVGHGEVRGGRGGGMITIKATERIHLAGEIGVDGGRGGNTTVAANCLQAAGGGGSAGGIFLSANYLETTDSSNMHAIGGDGGFGEHANGGGAGAGGVIAPWGIRRDPFDGARDANDGEPGNSDDCDGGHDSGGGATDEGETLERAAFVSLHDPSPNGFYRGDYPTVDVRAIDEDGQSEKVTICFRHLRPDAVNASIESLELNPPEDAADVGEVRDASKGCRTVDFDGPDGGSGFEYTRDEVSLETMMDDVFPAGTERDGFYGMYAFATDTGGIDDDQEFPPRVTHLRFGFDHSGPTISAEPTNGVEGCFDGSRCIRRGYGEADIVAEDLTSGVVEAKCTVNFTTKQLPCKTDHQGFRLGRGQGLRFIDAHLTNNAGNTPSPD